MLLFRWVSLVQLAANTVGIASLIVPFRLLFVLVFRLFVCVCVCVRVCACEESASLPETDSSKFTSDLRLCRTGVLRISAGPELGSKIRISRHSRCVISDCRRPGLYFCRWAGPLDPRPPDPGLGPASQFYGCRALQGTQPRMASVAILINAMTPCSQAVQDLSSPG